MTEQHPITPSPELVDKWLTEPEYGSPGLTTLHTLSKPRLTQMFTRAAQWGADTELKACFKLVSFENSKLAFQLQEARRPKPLSLKQQAMEKLLELNALLQFNDVSTSVIRRALEALPDD
jgi:hypothetical protein